MINFFKKKNSPAGLKEIEKIRVHLFVSGRVQGVFFREKTRRKAEKLGVFGWVKNLKDGRLEAVFEGSRQEVEKMLKWAKRGPFFAEVKKLDFENEEYKGEFSTFEIQYDLS